MESLGGLLVRLREIILPTCGRPGREVLAGFSEQRN
jgi:hypothetical protein